MSAPGPFGIRVPASRALLRGLALAVALTSCLVALLLAGSAAVGEAASMPARIVVAAAILVTSTVGGVGGVVLAVVGPWRARLVAALAFALAGVAGAVAYGVEVDGGPLAPAALTLASVAALVVHLVAAPGLADEAP